MSRKGVERATKGYFLSVLDRARELNFTNKNNNVRQNFISSRTIICQDKLAVAIEQKEQMVWFFKDIIQKKSFIWITTNNRDVFLSFLAFHCKQKTR